MQQSKALEEHQNENDVPGKLKTLLEDLRVQKDQNTKLRTQLRESERAGRQAHANMARLEQTVRDLKKLVEEQKK